MVAIAGVFVIWFCSCIRIGISGLTGGRKIGWCICLEWWLLSIIPYEDHICNWYEWHPSLLQFASLLDVRMACQELGVLHLHCIALFGIKVKRGEDHTRETIGSCVCY